jgi:hypothetical protein
VNINVEVAAPCDSTDIKIAVGDRCIPLTTEVATSQIHDTNNTLDKDFPIPAWTDTGVGKACSELATSTAAGIKMVGAVNFEDSNIGDLQSQLVLFCQ